MQKCCVNVLEGLDKQYDRCCLDALPGADKSHEAVRRGAQHVDSRKIGPNEVMR